MNIGTINLRKLLLRRYYKTAIMDWLQPRILHWAKIVTLWGKWKWERSDFGIKRKLVRYPALHVYQTVLPIKSETPPRGWDTIGYLLDDAIFFEMDLLDNGAPFNLWRIVDSVPKIMDLIDRLQDYSDYNLTRIVFSGFRGIHLHFKHQKATIEPIRLTGRKHRSRTLKDLSKERLQTARSIGYWSRVWDWQVSADLWRVARVPWSIHGSSALIAIALRRPITSKSIREQLVKASPFSSSHKINIRMKRHIPSFTFIDGVVYGPFRKGVATKLPINVALHLIWSGMARPRESGPTHSENWFERGWKTLFWKSCTKKHYALYFTQGGEAELTWHVP
ncbi:MAG: hypothetical protein ACTSYL_01670 [Candidatus Thorarchaeota archaeon]